MNISIDLKKNKADKAKEEKSIQQIREFQRSSPLNKKCMDCKEMGPQYVCLDFNTFICTACSGIHREFGHRVKSMSMSTFTENEVKDIIKFGGNDVATKFWRADYNSSKFHHPDPHNRSKVRVFIQKTYIDREWVFDDSPDPSKRKKKENRFSSDDDSDDHSSKKKSPNSLNDTKLRKKKSNERHYINDEDSPRPVEKLSSKEQSINVVTEKLDEWGAFNTGTPRDAVNQPQTCFDPFGIDSPASKPNDNLADFADFSTFTRANNKPDDHSMNFVDFSSDFSTTSNPFNSPEKAKNDLFVQSSAKNMDTKDVFIVQASPNTNRTNDPFSSLGNTPKTDDFSEFSAASEVESSLSKAKEADPFAEFDTIGSSQNQATTYPLNVSKRVHVAPEIHSTPQSFANPISGNSIFWGIQNDIKNSPTNQPPMGQQKIIQPYTFENQQPSMFVEPSRPAAASHYQGGMLFASQGLPQNHPQFHNPMIHPSFQQPTQFHSQGYPHFSEASSTLPGPSQQVYSAQGQQQAQKSQKKDPFDSLNIGQSFGLKKPSSEYKEIQKPGFAAHKSSNFNPPHMSQNRMQSEPSLHIQSSLQASSGVNPFDMF